MNDHQQKLLNKLYKAAEQDDWKLWRDSLVSLLPDVNRIDALNVIVKYVRQFLSDFYRIYPEDEGIRKSIEAFNNITSLEALSQQGQLTDILLDKYWELPGVSNFRNVFKGITKPHQYFGHSGEFVDTVVSILSGTFIAIEATNYWGSNPEFSKTFFGPDVQKAVFMAAKHYSVPQNIQMRRSLRAELAHDLEIALQAS